MSETLTATTEKDQQVRARKNLTYLLLFAIVMFFVALSSAYVVSQSSADYWVTFRIPKAFYISTAVILASSVSIQLALITIRKGQARATLAWILVTLLLGGAFTWNQRAGWSELMSRGYFLVSKVMGAQDQYGVDYSILRKGVVVLKEGDQFYLPSDLQRAKPLNAEMEDYKNTASSYFYVITVGHWLHLAGGIIMLLVLSVKSLMGRYTAEDHVGVWQGTLYWHFLGGLWVYLLLFLVFVH